MAVSTGLRDYGSWTPNAIRVIIIIIIIITTIIIITHAADALTSL